MRFMNSVTSDSNLSQHHRLQGGLRLKGVQKESEPGKPLISVITSTFNADQHLLTAIKSIREQTYSNMEWVIVDGASQDTTLDIIRRNEDVIDYWASEPDHGIYEAWNKGLHIARGDWICFLGADDFLWEPNVCERMAAALVLTNRTTNVVYGQMALVNARGEELYRVGQPWQELKSRFHGTMCIPHPGLMHHRSLFKARGGFDQTYKIAGDYELLLRELIHHEAVFVPDLIMVGMRVGGVSSDPAHTLISLGEVRRAQRAHGIFFPPFYWCVAMLKMRFRLLLWKIFGESRARKMLDQMRGWGGLPAHWSRTE